MTALLKKAFGMASLLPQPEQERLGATWIAQMKSEKSWHQLFKSSQELPCMRLLSWQFSVTRHLLPAIWHFQTPYSKSGEKSMKWKKIFLIITDSGEGRSPISHTKPQRTRRLCDLCASVRDHKKIPHKAAENTEAL